MRVKARRQRGMGCSPDETLSQVCSKYVSNNAAKSEKIAQVVAGRDVMRNELTGGYSEMANKWPVPVMRLSSSITAC